MTTDINPSFSEWLRAQLRVRRLSQRQLAQRSGVDHSTISRLIQGERTPSLATIGRLAQGLRIDFHDTDALPGLWFRAPATDPADRVERALRADARLTDRQVRRIMTYYTAERDARPARRLPEPHPFDVRIGRQSRDGLDEPQPIATIQSVGARTS